MWGSDLPILGGDGAGDDDSKADPPSESGSSWWGFIDKVKSTSQSLINSYKEDLQEFTNTVKEDTKKVVEEVTSQQPGVASAAATVSATLTTGLASMTGGLTSFFKNVTEIVEDQLLPVVESSFDDSNGSFEDEAEESDFAVWMKNFELNAYSEEIAKVMSSNSQISELYASLVPSELTPQEFWARYYFRVLKNQEKERMRVHLMEKAQSISEADIKWDDDDVIVVPEPAANHVSPSAAVAELESSNPAEDTLIIGDESGGGDLPAVGSEAPELERAAAQTDAVEPRGESIALEAEKMEMPLAGDDGEAKSVERHTSESAAGGHSTATQSEDPEIVPVPCVVLPVASPPILGPTEPVVVEARPVVESRSSPPKGNLQATPADDDDVFDWE